MKKSVRLIWFLSLILLVCTLTFTACNGGNDAQAPSGTTEENSTTNDSTTEESTVDDSTDETTTGKEDETTTGKEDETTTGKEDETTTGVEDETTAGKEDETTGGEPPVHEHSFGDWKTTKEATCTAKGEAERACACGEKETKPLDMKPHTEVVDAAKAPTCTETGLTEGKHCSVCKEVLVKQETVKALGHTEVTDAAKAPTCTETGLTEGKHCSVCKEVLKAQEIVKANGHTEVIDAAKAPTCTETGLTAGKHCSVCKTVLKAQETVKANGHTEVIDAAKAPTCLKTGLTEGKHCSVCNLILVEQTEIAVLEHNNYQPSLTPPTATENGKIVYTCSLCGDSYIEPITPKSFGITEQNRSLIGYTGEKGETLVIPAVFQNEGTWYRVVSISSTAFTHCSELTSITIPDSVTSISLNAFSDCSELTSITIPDSVTSIGYHAFSNCSKLIQEENGIKYVDRWVIGCNNSVTSVTLRDNTVGIATAAFQNISALTNITIPESIKNINSFAFKDCTNLTEINFNATIMNDTSSSDKIFTNAGTNTNGITVNIGANVTEVPAYLFYSSSKIVSVVFAERSVCESIGKNAFYGCNSLSSITIPYGVTTIGNSAFFDCSELTSVTIPNSVTTIGHSAFKNCNNLTSVTIPDSVTTIGESAFKSCNNLTNITIPASVTKIRPDAFRDCTNLTEINFNAAIMSDTSSGDKIFTNAGTNTNGITVNIGANVTEIPAYLFYSSSKIISVVFAEGSVCESIGKYAFYGCNSLSSITIPYGVTTIGDSAFRDCNELTSVTIPDSVTIIDNLAFGSCKKLANLTMSNGVITIGDYAFRACENLVSITIPNDVTFIGKEAFSGCTNLTEINFNATAMNHLKHNNKVFYNAGTDTDGITFNIGANVTRIPSFLFGDYDSYNHKGVAKILAVNFAEGSACETIGLYAFAHCSLLTSITIPESVTAIYSDAFAYCTGLTEINFNAILMKDDYCGLFFYGGIDSPGITVNIGAKVTRIPAHVFSHDNYNMESAPNIVSVVFAEGSVCESIGFSAFSMCLNLTNVTLREGLISLEHHAFGGCQNLSSITLPNSVMNVDFFAFSGCSKLAQEENGIVYVERWVFVSDYDETVVLRAGTVGIVNQVFSGREQLKRITIPDTVRRIGARVFSNCTRLTKIYFEGIMEQWNAISFGENWNYNVPATEVVCSDGVVKLK